MAWLVVVKTSLLVQGLVVVVGESGVGKTSLKKAIVEHLDQQDLICEIGVPVLTSCDKILKSII